MANIILLLDEDVRLVLGEILRQRGYDALHVGGEKGDILNSSLSLIC